METNKELQIIVEGCVKGKRKYQKMLFERFYGKMLGVCMRYAKDPDEAKDMAQNGFIKVYKKLDVYNFQGSLEGWIRRIMVNTAIDQIRKNKRDPFQLDDSIPVEDEQVEVPFESEEQETEIKIKAEKALAAINNLSTGYKTVFNLYVIEGYSHKEIADYLGISEGTSKSNLAKAKQKLREQLG
ncbi:MAG: RNA polymerase sigma factor [Putridiphycobacter sp.]